MPSLKAIRNRIASVKNTQKITRAMKLVAAARLRRAQQSVVAARPYAQRLSEVIADVAARAAEDSAKTGEPAHPLLEQRDVKKVEIILVTSDRGLAGGFNSNLIRRTERFLVDNRTRYESIALTIVGRKGREYFRRRSAKIIEEIPFVTGDQALVRAREIAQRVSSDFLAGKVDAVYLIYNEFKSAIAQIVRVEPLLPIQPAEVAMSTEPVKSTAPGTHGAIIDFEYEPSKNALLSTLVPLFVEIQIYRALLESVASFFGAQMSSMDSATKNAKEMIGSLTLEFNRARQAAITKELMEIVGGAEALKG